MMNTVLDILGKLSLARTDNEFRWTKDGFTVNKQQYYRPGDLQILKTFRFEGESDPSDMEILYIIKANDGTMGYSLDAYGVYSSHENESGYNNFIRQIPEAGHEHQLLFEL
jgi:hypothetical protein